MTKRRGPMPASHEGKGIAGPITEQEKHRRMRAVRGADALWAGGEITHEEMVETLIKRHTRVKRSEQSL